VLANDLPALAHFSERDWAEIVFGTHSGMSQAEFLEFATKWLETAEHPKFKWLFTEMIYQPMFEVLGYPTAWHLVEVGNPMRSIASCAACHGALGVTFGAPGLRGQQRAYLE
jgi:hypothetical protein